jgi:hypothetical protein
MEKIDIFYKIAIILVFILGYFADVYVKTKLRKKEEKKK